MKRIAFVAGAAAATFPLGARAGSLRDAVEQAASSSSGIVGVYARRLGFDGAAVSYNSEERFPAASVIKLLILVTLYQVAEREPGIMQSSIRLRESDMVGGSDFLAQARPGDAFKVAGLAHAMITKSDNTASNALITLLGFDRINATASLSNLKHTQLKRHFLDYTAIVRHSENLTSPHDIGALLYQIERGSHEGIRTIASPQSCRQMIEILLQQEDRDKIVRGLPKGTPVANKTGEVDYVRNDVAIVDPMGDAPYVLAVMTKGLNDYSAGLNAIRHIAKAVNAAIGG